MEENLNRLVGEHTAELEKAYRDLKRSLSEIKILQGVIPICSHCEKTLDERGFWKQEEPCIQ